MSSFYPVTTGGHESIILNILYRSNIQNYLELGVYKGDIIREASMFIPTCVGVDITRHFTYDNKFSFYQMTTDAFFLQNKQQFDAIFIDADHKIESCITDLENSLKILNYNGYIFIHDTDPISLKYTDFGYCGDSYKINDYISETHTELDMITLPITESGITIVKYKNQNRYNTYIVK